jgi:hypothetical protein
MELYSSSDSHYFLLAQTYDENPLIILELEVLSLLIQKNTQLIMKEIHKPHFARPKEKLDPNIPVIYYEETHTQGNKYDVPLVIFEPIPVNGL